MCYAWVTCVLLWRLLKRFKWQGEEKRPPFAGCLPPMPEFNVSSYHIVCVQWRLIVFRGTQWMSLVLWRCPPVGNGAVERTEALKQQCCAFPSFLLHFYFPFFPFLCLTIFLTYLCSAPTSLPPLGPPHIRSPRPLLSTTLLMETRYTAAGMRVRRPGLLLSAV